MKRLCWITAVGLAACGAAQAGSPEGVKRTIAYVQKLQTSTGGFLSMAPKPNVRLMPTLRSTSSAVRALKYLGGEIPNPDACEKFVASCFDKESGGFSDLPGGKPDVFATAVGVMAVAELKMPLDSYSDPAVRYLSEHAKSFDDIRIAVAGLERLGKKSPRNADWLAEIDKLAISDDTGPKSGVAREAASIMVTRMRLGGEYSSTDQRIKIIQDGQRPSGGYGKEATATSDLESTYRVMRAFVMLKSQPKSLEGLRSFVAKCRNDDGGYGVSPGESSNVSATYFAAIIQHWLKDMK